MGLPKDRLTGPSYLLPGESGRRRGGDNVRELRQYCLGDLLWTLCTDEQLLATDPGETLEAGPGTAGKRLPELLEE